jgi:hypothetical protein
LSRLDEELVFRAFLDQPLVLYGHHTDAADGLDAFAEAAAKVGALEGVRWQSLGDVARTNFAARREGDLLRLRLFSRDVALTIPEGVGRVVVDPSGCASELDDVRAKNGRLSSPGDELGVEPQARLELSLVRRRAADEPIAVPRWGPWPLVRRLMTESRDRMAPLARRRRRHVAAFGQLSPATKTHEADTKA